MEKNIFEGAKFGDKFVTRDGRIALYLNWIPSIYRGLDANGFNHQLFIQDACPIQPFIFKDNGEGDFANRGMDIVSRWEEPIDDDSPKL